MADAEAAHLGVPSIDGPQLFSDACLRLLLKLGRERLCSNGPSTGPHDRRLIQNVARERRRTERTWTRHHAPSSVDAEPAVLGLSSNVYEEKQSYATGTAYLKTVTKKCDAVGNKTSEVYPSNLALTYTWTDVNQADTITDGTNTIADYTYAGLRRKQLLYGNGSKTLFSYSGFRGEVATIDHQDNSSNTLLRLDYGYNKLHDRTYERFGASGSAGDAFEYDKARRLTVAWMGSSTPASPSGNTYTKKIEYGMDDDGNRTSVVTTPYGSSPTTVSYTDNSLNQYTAVGGVSRSHDGNGNVSDDGTYTYAFNYKNLIVKATRKSDSAVVGEYKYDALGRRVEKSVTGATYRYIYSGVETVSVYTSTGTWKQDYVYGPGIDEVIMLEQADVLDWDADSNTTELARSWYMKNALGSVMQVQEHDRSEAVTYRYDPYGEVTITRGGSGQSSDSLGQYVTYTGRWRDEETDLHYYRVRGLDPVRGVFVQRDPLGVLEGSRLYEYVSSSPMSNTDPTGLWVEVCCRDVIGRPCAQHAYIRVTVPGGPRLYFGFFSGGGTMNKERNEGTSAHKQKCRPVKRMKNLMVVVPSASQPIPFFTPTPSVHAAPMTSYTGIPCDEIDDKEVVQCLLKAYLAIRKRAFTNRHSCGDWACDLLQLCCSECEWTLCGGGA